MIHSLILQQIKKVFYDINNLFLYLLLLTPFIYVENLFDKVNLPRRAYIALIASIWLLTWLIKIKNKKISLNWNPLFFVIIFLLSFAAISFFWGSENMLYQADIYFYTSLVIICFMSMQIDSNTIIKFISVAAITASACALIGILQNFAINPFEYKQTAPPAATFINKNFAANFFDLILPLTIVLFLTSKNKNDAWRSAIIVSLIAGYIILTKSRGAYISTIVTLTLLFIFIQLFPWLKKRAAFISGTYKKQIIFIICIPVLLSYLPLPNKSFQSGFDENRYAKFFSNSKQDSISSRFNAYKNSLDLMKENPVFGVGLGGFQQNFRPYLQSILAKNKIFSDFIYLHNEPLQLFVELGIIGGVTAFLFFILLIRFSFSRIKLEPEIKSDLNIIRTKILHIGFFIAIIASIAHSMVSFPYHQPASATFMALWVGFMLNLSAKKVLLSKFKKLQIAHVLAITTSLVFLLGIANFYFKYIESSIYMNQSKTTEDCNKASERAILSINTYTKDYLSQSQGINIVAACPVDTKIQLLFAKNILDSNPTHPWALYFASISYFKLGDYESSYKLLKLLTYLYPYFSNAYTLIGHIAIKNKDYIKAKSYYMHALKLAPDNFEAKSLLRQLSEKGY